MRKSGILLHISSLPSSYGIGTFGKEAYHFIDELKQMGQSYWQVLPLGPTSYGDSPYQTFSVFAGNPYFIDYEMLIEEGLINYNNINESPNANENYVNYERLYKTKYTVLKIAYNNFTKQNHSSFDKFCYENMFWLDDYALFMTIKNNEIEGNWKSWRPNYQNHNSKEVQLFASVNQFEINFWKFIQYKFFEQWNKLKNYANSQEIEIIGDMPIYVSYDSSDVWSNPGLWQLDENLVPKVVAGVPPDYFSQTGQLWGNPIYDYDKMKNDNYSWWIKRIEYSFKMYDIVRIDHFRGFEAYYAIPYGDKTAERGKWVKGPGLDLFDTVKKQLGNLKIIAEDLGLLTKEVKKLLADCGYPGMKVLQFAFNPNDDSDYLPHNYISNSICYTGTHDNMTLKAWLNSISQPEKAFCFKYAGINDESIAIKRIISLALGSVSERVIIPLRDYLELGTEARFNTPSTLGGNWTWRLKKDEIKEEKKQEILELTKLYKRI